MKKLSDLEEGAARRKQARDAEHVRICAWVDELDNSEIAPFEENDKRDAIRRVMRDKLRKERHKLIDVLCDHCETQLVNRRPNVMTAGIPPKIVIGCPGCGWTGWVRANYHLDLE